MNDDSTKDKNNNNNINNDRHSSSSSSNINDSGNNNIKMYKFTKPTRNWVSKQSVLLSNKEATFMQAMAPVTECIKWWNVAVGLIRPAVRSVESCRSAACNYTVVYEGVLISP